MTPQDSEPAPQITLLSEDELEAVSGGLVNVSLTLMIAEDNCEFMTQEFSGGGHSGSITFGQSKRSLFGLKFSGSFESMDHFFSCFSRVMDCFGRR